MLREIRTSDYCKQIIQNCMTIIINVQKIMLCKPYGYWLAEHANDVY